VSSAAHSRVPFSLTTLIYSLRRVSDAKLVFTFHRNSSTNHILSIYCTASASDLVLVEVGWKKVLRAHSIVTLEVSKTDTCDNLILPSPGSNEMPPQLSRNLFSTLTALRSAFPTCPDVVAQYLDGTAEPTRKKRKLAGTDWPLAAPAAKVSYRLLFFQVLGCDSLVSQ